MPDSLTAAIATMSDLELDQRLTLRTGMAEFDTGTDSASWQDWQDWRNNGFPLLYRRLRYLIDPMTPGPIVPGVFCSDSDYMDWAEGLYEAYTPITGTPRERANHLAHWLWLLDP